MCHADMDLDAIFCTIGNLYEVPSYTLVLLTWGIEGTPKYGLLISYPQKENTPLDASFTSNKTSQEWFIPTETSTI